MTLKRTVFLVPLVLLALSARAQDDTEIRAINATLDQLHTAASKADGTAYFNLFTDNAIYIGTDAGERWTIPEFRDFAAPYFSKGQGWTYKATLRHVTIPNIPCRCIAGFDEILDSKSYGTSRGTGVLRKQNGIWKIEQYALSFPIPNDLAKGITTEIKAFESRQKKQ